MAGFIFCCIFHYLRNFFPFDPFDIVWICVFINILDKKISMQGIFVLSIGSRKVIRFFSGLLCMISPFMCFSQVRKLETKNGRLLLQLGAGYLNVVRENQIDLDSGLALAAKRNQLSRMAVIAEGYDEILTDPANKWIANENIDMAKAELSLSNGSKRIQLFNIIGSYYVFQPAARQNDLDSALFYLEQAKKEEEVAGDQRHLCLTLRLFGKYYLEKGDLPQADKTFSQAVSISGKHGYLEEEAMSLLFWAAFSPYQPNTIGERINHLKTADSLFGKTGNIQNRIIARTDIGYLSFAGGNFEESKNSFLEVLKLEKEINFPFTHYTTDLLAMMAYAQGQQGVALEYAMMGIKSADATGDGAMKGYLYCRIGDSYSFRHVDRSPFEWYMKGMEEFEKVGDDPFRSARAIVYVLENTGESKEAIELTQQMLRRFPPKDSLQKQGVYLSLAKLYTSRHSYSDAEKYLQAAEKIQENLFLRYGTLNTSEFYFQMANGYFAIKRFDQARMYYNKLLGPTIALEVMRESNVEYSLYYMDSVDGNFQGAFNHLHKFLNLTVKMMDEKQASANESLRIQYETEKKDNNIKILNQQAEIQKTQIKQDKLTRSIMIAGGAVLLVFLGLLYNRYRLKQSQQQVVSQKNVVLQHLVEEKEFLMKEIHHRVKNNLQIVISLLNTQSKFLDNEEAIAAISESRHRMQAMSLIHQKLYQSENVAFVSMPGYIREMVDYLDMSFNVGQRIKFELNIDAVDLDISQAIPVGLILNEAVTNCIKHAFTDQPNGIIRVSMRKMADEMIYLEISDNGKGLPANFDFKSSQSLGIRLIRGLIEQIGGELNFSDQDGCRIATTFKQDLVLRPVAV
jgi:two-component system, sensor histidine kinase PdtaS